jgi:hypothetical protein
LPFQFHNNLLSAKTQMWTNYRYILSTTGYRYRKQWIRIGLNTELSAIDEKYYYYNYFPIIFHKCPPEAVRRSYSCVLFLPISWHSSNKSRDKAFIKKPNQHHGRLSRICPECACATLSLWSDTIVFSNYYSPHPCRFLHKTANYKTHSNQPKHASQVIR